MSTSTTTARLTDQQVTEYRREGFLIYPDAVFAQPKFDALKEHFEQKLAQLPPYVRPEAMDVPHFTDPKLFDWLLSDEVLDLVEPIIGPDIALFSSHFICKPKGNGKKVPWHEDSYYWKGRLEPMEVATVWLAIDPSTRENGAMQVIPRTLHGYSEYDAVDPVTNVFATEIKKSMRDDSKAVTIELEPNHVSLHDSHLMHGSPPNHSQLRRCGYTMRFMPTTTKMTEDLRGVHQIYLARGQDRAGNVYGDPTKSYDALAHHRASEGTKLH